MAEAQTAPTPVTDAADDQRSATGAYRPHLDGLRAIAVYLVVLFHAGLTSLSGGYIGVDVFFVLSGYLVTMLLVRDLAQGSIRFGRFYARRFRRLLPAAFVTLMVTALVFAAVTPSGAAAAYGAFRAAFLYVANWYFIRQSTSYFGAAVAANPVLQFWSLAVEEQFYLLWPLALAAIFWAARRFATRQAMFVRAAVALGGLASLLWALHLRTGDVNRAYFGTDARAYQLMAGASIALLPSLAGRLNRFPRAIRLAALVAVVALIGLATSLDGLDPILRGAAVAVVTCLVLVVLEYAPGGAMKRILSTDLFVYLGKISYGTYLWHWPVIILAGLLLHLTPAAMAWFACLVATGLASLSFQLLERPVRQSPQLDRHRVMVIAAGLTVSVLSAFVLIPAVITTEPTSDATPVAATSGLTPVPSWVDTAAVYHEGFGTPIVPGKGGQNPIGCVGESPDRCTVVHGSGLKILLMGDSNAEMMIPAFTKIAEEHDFTLSLEVTAGCPWQRDWYTFPTQRRICTERKEDAYERVIPALNPDLIVLMDVTPVGDRGPRPGHATDPTMVRTTTTSLRLLATGHRKVVIIEPMPVSPANQPPLPCLETARWLESCRYVADTDPSNYQLLIRQEATHIPDVWTADFDRLVCPYLPICDPIVNGAVVKWDGEHLSTRFSATLAPAITDWLSQRRVLSR